MPITDMAIIVFSSPAALAARLSPVCRREHWPIQRRFCGRDRTSAQRHRLRCIAAVRLLASSIVWSQHGPGQTPAGARIVMGEAIFSRAGKAFHYWNNAKEIPAVSRFPCDEQ